ncbi:MAG: ABC transporter ATP-binding protein [Crenarchaeota archaeon]|jgi:iron complex transport system ATP-binding protein|nr:ABC transporter ATP-binding protein [Thermoproteota archaeon]
MVTLNVTGVECRYGSTKILSGINLDVKPGDFVGVLGPNGSGKTTLLKSISRVLKPHVGSILIDKDEIYSLKPLEVAKKLAVVPQDTTVGFNFSVLDVVLMGRNPHLGRFQMESSSDVEIAKKAMMLTNTWGLADRSINELSGGERQRVIIARALAQEPKILLLDEPMSHLDIINQLEVMDLVKSLCVTEGLSVIAVIHDLNMAARYCSSLLLLKSGTVYAFGETEKVLTHENIRSVFSVDVIVRKNAVTNSLYVIPLSPKKPCTKKRCTVHLICGAGTGMGLMKALIDEGYTVTTGVLNKLDSDFEASEMLNVPTVVDAPFSSITDQSFHMNLDMITRAAMVVVTNVPFGLGNLRNLEAAKKALEYGIPTYVIDEIPIEERDFTDGKAIQLMSELKKDGAIFIKNPLDILALLNLPKAKPKVLSDKEIIKEHMKPT